MQHRPTTKEAGRAKGDSVFDACIELNKGKHLVTSKTDKVDQREFMERMTSLENQNITRKAIYHPILFPLPKKLGLSVYRKEFEKFKMKDLKGAKQTKTNMEIDAQEIFTKLNEKNNFRQESVTSTAATLNEINNRINKMRCNSSNPTDNIYEINVPMIKDYLRDMREMQLD